MFWMSHPVGHPAHSSQPASTLWRASSSLLDEPAEDPQEELPPSPSSPAGKQLQREASASILCRQASELRRDSSQVGGGPDGNA